MLSMVVMMELLTLEVATESVRTVSSADDSDLSETASEGVGEDIGISRSGVDSGCGGLSCPNPCSEGSASVDELAQQ
jgi:hypothetical protein